MKNYSGSCLCKKVAFEILGDFKKFFMCHCSRCRKQSGSAHASNLFCSGASLTWLGGTSFVKTYGVPNSRFVHSFCSECGSPLPNTNGNGDIKVPAGCLDVDVDLRPTGHIFMGSKANWDHDLESIRSYEELPV